MRNARAPTCSPYERVPSNPVAMHSAGCERPSDRESRSDQTMVLRWKVRLLDSLAVRVRNSTPMRPLPSKTRRSSWIAHYSLTSILGPNGGQAVYFSRRR